MLFHLPPPAPSSSSCSCCTKLVCFQPSLVNPNPCRTSLPFLPTHLRHPSPKPPRPPLVLLASSSDPTPSKKITRCPRKDNTTTPKDSISDDDTRRLNTKPPKPRRGRRSEAVHVEDFIRRRVEQTFRSFREKRKGEIPEDKKAEVEEQEEEAHGKEALVKEEDPDWPVDAEVGGGGLSASEYFEKHAIKNVEVDGVEIDWEGELDNAYVQEVNCLEWESFAFHPSPLMVLVFERYTRATDNWMIIKELEKAAKVYLDSRSRLPPRMVKIDINIETDLAYALKVRQCPQLLFVRGNRILYREKELRTADELVQMIAYFYYNAKKPSWVDEAAIPRYPY